MGRRVEVAPHAHQDAEDALKARRSDLRRLILSRVDYERAEPVLRRHGHGHRYPRAVADQVAIYEAAARELVLNASDAPLSRHTHDPLGAGEVADELRCLLDDDPTTPGARQALAPLEAGS